MFGNLDDDSDDEEYLEMFNARKAKRQRSAAPSQGSISPDVDKSPDSRQTPKVGRGRPKAVTCNNDPLIRKVSGGKRGRPFKIKVAKSPNNELQSLDKEISFLEIKLNALRKRKMEIITSLELLDPVNN
jgi:hypothetical protein